MFSSCKSTSGKILVLYAFKIAKITEDCELCGSEKIHRGDPYIRNEYTVSSSSSGRFLI